MGGTFLGVRLMFQGRSPVLTIWEDLRSVEWSIVNLSWPTAATEGCLDLIKARGIIGVVNSHRPVFWASGLHRHLSRRERAVQNAEPGGRGGELRGFPGSPCGSRQSRNPRSADLLHETLVAMPDGKVATGLSGMSRG